MQSWSGDGPRSAALAPSCNLRLHVYVRPHGQGHTLGPPCVSVEHFDPTTTGRTKSTRPLHGLKGNRYTPPITTLASAALPRQACSSKTRSPPANGRGLTVPCSKGSEPWSKQAMRCMGKALTGSNCDTPRIQTSNNFHIPQTRLWRVFFARHATRHGALLAEKFAAAAEHSQGLGRGPRVCPSFQCGVALGTSLA